MALRLNGSTSGYVELDAPAVAGTTALTLPDTSGTVATQAYADTAGATLGGLVHIATESFSAVSGLNVNNCFTSTYKNYKLILNVDSVSTANQVGIRMRAGGVDNSSNNYLFNGPDFDDSSDTTPGAFRSAGVASQFTTIAADNTGTASAMRDIYNPQASLVTQITGETIETVSTEMRAFGYFGRMTVTTSYDGFSLIVNTGTITGSVRVYGYLNS